MDASGEHLSNSLRQINFQLNPDNTPGSTITIFLTNNRDEAVSAMTLLMSHPEQLVFNGIEGEVLEDGGQYCFGDIGSHGRFDLILKSQSPKIKTDWTCRFELRSVPGVASLMSVTGETLSGIYDVLTMLDTVSQKAYVDPQSLILSSQSDILYKGDYRSFSWLELLALSPESKAHFHWFKDGSEESIKARNFNDKIVYNPKLGVIASGGGHDGILDDLGITLQKDRAGFIQATREFDKRNIITIWRIEEDQALLVSFAKTLIEQGVDEDVIFNVPGASTEQRKEIKQKTLKDWAASDI